MAEKILKKWRKIFFKKWRKKSRLKTIDDYRFQYETVQSKAPELKQWQAAWGKTLIV